jgi:enoyl-CoA hydratase/carnithine racemase
VTDTNQENEGHGPEVLYEVADHVATITLNRPHRRNAISVRMLQLLTERFAEADDDGDVRVVILTGAGKGFCAGLDIKDAMAGTGIGSAAGGGGGASFLQTRNLPTVVLQEMDTPVICVLNGAAAGYGLDLALGCDLRLMAASTKLIPGFAKRGVVPESGGTWYLPRLIGWAKAAEIAYLGRDLTAAEAEAMGLVNRAVPDDELLPLAH